MNTDLKSSYSVLQTSMVSSDSFVNQLKKSYQADQQVKYLSLKADIDLLLHKLQNYQQVQPLRPQSTALNPSQGEKHTPSSFPPTQDK